MIEPQSNIHIGYKFRNQLKRAGFIKYTHLQWYPSDEFNNTLRHALGSLLSGRLRSIR